MRYPPPRERFLASFRLDAASGCHVWTALRGRGYGRFYVKGRTHRAHRWWWEQSNGAVPDGMVLDHLCRNPACVNLAHLEVVTVRENTIRGVGFTAVNAKKTECLRGHPLSGDNLRLRRLGRECHQCRRDRRPAENLRRVRA